MEGDYGPAAQGAVSFHTTRWAIVVRAAQRQHQGGESALAQLCRVYWYPHALLCEWVSRTVPDPAEIEEKTIRFTRHHSHPKDG